MPLIYVLIVLAVVGLLVWLLNAYWPMDPKFKTLINIVAIVGCIVWLLQVFGLIPALLSVRIK
jgi:amino acid permease